MRKVPEVCITTTFDSNIKFQEKNNIIQLAKKEFRDRYKSTLTVSKTPLNIKLY